MSAYTEWQQSVAVASATVTKEEQELAAARAALQALLATPPVPSGPDVSQFQGTFDWATVKNNADFAFVRVADGDLVDTQWTTTRVGQIHATGLPFGPYYFGRVAAPGNLQRNGRVEAGMATWFAQRAGWTVGDLPLAYDFETLNGQPVDKAARHFMEFIRGYSFIAGHRPIVYTNPATVNAIFDQLSTTDRGVVAECPLWIAHWGVTTPTVPAPWSKWTFWQYTSTGTLPGITGNVDLNRFNGGPTELAALRIA